MRHRLSLLPISRRIGLFLLPQLHCPLRPRASSSRYDLDNRSFGNMTDIDFVLPLCSCARDSRCSDASWSLLQIISIFYYCTSRLLFPRRTSLDVLSPHCVTLLSDPPPRFIVSSTNISTSTYFTYDIGISPPG